MRLFRFPFVPGIAILLAASAARAQTAPDPRPPTETSPGAEVAPDAPAAPPASESPPPAAPPPPTTTAPAESAAPAATADAAGWGDVSKLAQIDPAPVFRAKLYGFIDAHLEKQFKTPDSIDSAGQTRYVTPGYEFDIPNLHVMVQGALYDKYRFFVNLASPGSGNPKLDEALLVRNAWVEMPIFNKYLNARVGKMYRRFGLYNEILDAVPTFIGIEPPEMFDKDHLLLTRTTNLMFHGLVDIGPNVINYSVATGNDERGTGVPMSLDANFEAPFGLRLGSSFYSSMGSSVPTRAVGEGSPAGGVANWMQKDQFKVYGGYAQLKKAGVILQAEYWRADHQAKRDADALALLAESGSLNANQLGRMFINGDPKLGINRDANYSVNTFYVRAGYEIGIGQLASITPYLQYDYYENAETIKNKDLGGDAEAGLADKGIFEKYTAGAVFRPVPQVAFKLDGSAHRQNFNGTSELYPEIRTSFAYLWELGQ
jgi:hypothetical protein